MTNDNLVLRRLEGRVLLLTLNRPGRHNSWTVELEEAYFEALTEAAADRDVHVIVVTGAGTSFCPGLDMDVLSAATEGKRLSSRPRRPLTYARSIPKPVITAINGACAGIGLIQACSSDIRFAARGAKFTTAFARRGLPAESALSWLLPRLVGTGRAMDLLLSSRVILAEEAHAIGLVDHLCAPEELLSEAMAYARDMAENCAPRSLAVIKQQVLDDWEQTAEESRSAALGLLAQLRDEPDFVEGVRSFTAKRRPNFDGLSANVVVTPE